MILQDCLKKYTIIPDISSVKLHEIDDNTYFGPDYKHYISNSKLKLINPDEGGTFRQYLEGLKPTITSSLSLGSAVHEILLQGDEFEISEQTKPTAKAGAMIDVIFKYRQKGCKIIDSLIYASEEVDYYNNQLSALRIKTLIKNGIKYYLHLLHVKDIKYEKSQIYLDQRSRATALQCIENVRRHTDAMDLLHPDAFSMNNILNRNEDCITLGVDVSFPNSLTDPNAPIVTQHLDLKIKIDNWSIDFDDKKIYLNDLKTSGKPLYMFPGSTVEEIGEFIEGSFQHYHYYRQIALYSWVLLIYLKQKYWIEDLKQNWKHYINMIVVSTVPQYQCGVFRVNQKWLLEGYKEFITLLKYAAFAEYNREKLLNFEI